jgi:hypothetical protein
MFDHARSDLDQALAERCLGLGYASQREIPLRRAMRREQMQDAARKRCARPNTQNLAFAGSHLRSVVFPRVFNCQGVGDDGRASERRNYIPGLISSNTARTCGEASAYSIGCGRLINLSPVLTSQGRSERQRAFLRGGPQRVSAALGAPMRLLPTCIRTELCIGARRGERRPACHAGALLVAGVKLALLLAPEPLVARMAPYCRGVPASKPLATPKAGATAFTG